jgi:hypothetical protein
MGQKVPLIQLADKTHSEVQNITQQHGQGTQAPRYTSEKVHPREAQESDAGELTLVSCYDPGGLNSLGTKL